MLFRSDIDHIYIIMEYANKGNLFRLIKKKKKLTEKESFFFFTQVCSVVHFLHSHKLMHRDIKPENLLISENGIIKLCDFGNCASSDNRKTFCGTIEYMAPEILNRTRYDEKADIWSLGILLYEMLHGHAPYHGRTDKDTISMILNNKFEFDDIKEDAKELIRALIKENPSERPEAWEIFTYPWMKRLQVEFGIAEIPEEIQIPSNAQSFTETNNEQNTNDTKLIDKRFLSTKEQDKVQLTPSRSQKSTTPNQQINFSEKTKPKVLPPDSDINLYKEFINNEASKCEKNPHEELKISKGKIPSQVEEIINKNLLIKQNIDDFPRVSLHSTRKSKMQSMQESNNDIFHVENRRSTWTEIGFPNFVVDDEPLFYVNNYLERLKHNPNLKSNEVFKDITPQLKSLTGKQEKKLLGGDSQNEDSDRSYDSDDYAYQRSEIILKVVDYLDIVDNDPFSKSTQRVTHELYSDYQRLKKICDKIKDVELDEEENLSEDKRSKHKENNNLNEINTNIKLNDVNNNSEYRQSIGEMMGTLVKLSQNDSNFDNRRIHISNISQNDMIQKEAKVSKVTNKLSIWSTIFSFDVKTNL